MPARNSPARKRCASSPPAELPHHQFRTFDRTARIYQSSASPGELRLLPRLLTGGAAGDPDTDRTIGQVAMMGDEGQ